MKIVRIYELLSEKNIILELNAQDKEGVIRELVEVLVSSEKLPEGEPLLEEALKRERLGSTGLGEGIAIPHARSDTIDSIAVAFGLSSRGVEFEALDGKPVKVIIFFAIPTTSVREYLMLLAHTARLFKKKELVGALFRCSSPSEVLKVFRKYES